MPRPMGSSSFRAAKVLPPLALAFLVHAPPAAAQTAPPAPSQRPASSDSASTSLAGTQLVPTSSPASPGGAVAVPVTATVASSPQDLERRVDVLESRLDAANALLKDYEGELRWLRMFKVSGYIQPQLLLQFFNASGSPNAVGGTLPSGITSNDVTATPATSSVPTTNQDYFR